MNLSAEATVMFAPASAHRRIAKEPSGHWLARPLAVLLVYGCAVSVMTSGRLTLRLLLPAMLYASFIPALQIGSLAVVLRRSMPFRRAVDLFFAGHGPWSLWLLGWAAVWGWASPQKIYPHVTAWHESAVLVFLWSAYVDYWFFRAVLGRPVAAAARDLAIQRVVCWIPALAIFVAPAGWQVSMSALGL